MYYKKKCQVSSIIQHNLIKKKKERKRREKSYHNEIMFA